MKQVVVFYPMNQHNVGDLKCLVYDYCTLTHLSYSYQLFHIWICCISCVFVSAFISEASITAILFKVKLGLLYPV